MGDLNVTFALHATLNNVYAMSCHIPLIPNRDLLLSPGICVMLDYLTIMCRSM